MMFSLTAIRSLTVVLITILLGIVIIGIMNTMWIAIRERTREIGTLRAIGMQRRQVLWMFLLESLLLGLFSTAAGATVGALIAGGLNLLQIPIPISAQLFLMSTHLRLAVHPSLLVQSVAAITVVTGLAALYPSLRAARLRPVVAMSHFG
jgi:ABC-type antimicrobial peptide transport system permease subunit